MDLVGRRPRTSSSFGAFRSGRLLGALRVIPGGQFVHGRSVPMGGIAAVVVRPEARGAGVARALLADSIAWMRDDGHRGQLAPSRVDARVPQRRMGVAGRAGWLTVPTRSFARSAATRRRRSSRSTPTGGPEVHACYAALRARRARRRRPVAGVLVAARARRAARTARSCTASAPTASSPGTSPTPRPRRAVLGLRAPGRRLRRARPCVRGRALAVHRRALDAGRAGARCRSRALPALSFLLDEQDAVTDLENHWMHRIVDVPGAIAARGFPAGVAGSVDRRRRVRSAHARRHGGLASRSTAAHGTAVAADADAAEVTLDIGALSALAIGGTTVGLLRRAGRLDGPDDALAAPRRPPADADAGDHRRLLSRGRCVRTARPDRQPERGERPQGAVEGTPGGDHAPLGAVEVAGDGRILGVAVAVGDRHDRRVDSSSAERRVLSSA